MKRLLKKLRQLFMDRRMLAGQLRWLLSRAKPVLPRLLLLFGIEVLTSALAVGLSLVNKRIIDSAIQSRGSFDTVSFALMIALTLVNIGVGAGSGFLSMLIKERYEFSLRSRLYDQLLHTRWQSLRAYHSGDLQTRLTGDLSTVADGISSLIPTCLSLLVHLLLAFVVLFNYDRMLALAALMLGPCGVIAGILFSGKMHEYETKLRTNESIYRSYMQESIAGITVTKAFSREKDAHSTFSRLRDERVSLVRKRGIIGVLNRLTMGLVFSGGYLLSFGWGISRVALGAITYGTMSIFLSLVSQIQGPIMGLGNIVPRLISMLACAGRVMEIENLPAEEPAVEPKLSGAVGARLDHVNFTYKPYPGETTRPDAVLRDVSLTIRPGESVALVGLTGSGKTTIARLLLDLVDPDSGTAEFYDEQGGHEKASPGTRSLIAYVPQGNTLTSGTIRENLVLSRKVPQEEIEKALRIAEADFALELGLDTRIGERGIGLSEGQAQRLAIARALLRHSPFLILDEASASLDMQTEQNIMENLRAAKTGITCLVITHRPSLLEICDRCYRVVDGRVEEVVKQ